MLRRLILMTALLSFTTPAPAGEFDLAWHTIDGGGGTSAGGSFTLSGTIGQSDANSFSTPVSGGVFTLVGGFWPAGRQQCSLLGDMNLDGLRNGIDVQDFVNCFIGVNGANCSCADFDGNGSIDAADMAAFLQTLLS